MIEDDEIPEAVPDVTPPASAEPRCEHCKRTAADFVLRWEARGATRLPVRLLEMQPGPDGKAWCLCLECHVPGKVERPVGEQTPPQPTQPKAVKVTRPRAPRKPKATAQH